MTVFFLTLPRAPAPHKGERGGGGGGRKEKKRRKKEERRLRHFLSSELGPAEQCCATGGDGRRHFLHKQRRGERQRQIKSSMGTLLSRKSCFIPAMAPSLGAY